MKIDLANLVGKLDDPCRNALENATGSAIAHSHYAVEVEHWLLKLLELPDPLLASLLTELGVDQPGLRSLLTQTQEQFKSGCGRTPALAPTLLHLIEKAWLLASVECRQTRMRAVDLWAVVLSDAEYFAASLALPDTCHAQGVKRVLQGLAATAADQTGHSMDATADTAGQGGAGALARFTFDITAAARAGDIDAITGRDLEIRQVVDTLCRRRQNNPILTGEAGVGKTAVVEGLALQIVAEDVPAALRGVRLLALDLALLQAGAGVKGEFEQRLKSVINEVRNAVQPIILFIDEAHTMIGAGGKEGQNDAANLLKPALARGELRTIAATTWAEYKQFFDRDPALSRRFQVVKVEEPDEASAIDMLRVTATALEQHHQVRILDSAIVEAVRLSRRYITSRQLPDKAISVLDTACARVALSQQATPPALETVNRRLTQIDVELRALNSEQSLYGGVEQRLHSLLDEQEACLVRQRQLRQQWQAEQGIAREAQALAATMVQRVPEAGSASPELQQSREKLHAKLAELRELQGEAPLLQLHVSGQSVAEVIAGWTGIPIGRMATDDIDKIAGLEAELSARITGQNHACAAIARSVQVSRTGLCEPHKPRGVFLLVGPSGVGKTETAHALAESLYGSRDRVTVINMSEFKEEHKVSMLLGAPPGYVGYGRGGVLTEAVRQNPYSVVLLDEMEKAHSGVQDIFYQLFDKGVIKDGEGRDIDFRNTMIIMTSNAASELLTTTPTESPGFTAELTAALGQFFRPAFLSRTEVIAYRPLSQASLEQVCTLKLQALAERIDQHYHARLRYDTAVLRQIVQTTLGCAQGARRIGQTIQQTLLPEIASQCIAKMAAKLDINEVALTVDDTDGLICRVQ